jgi:wyosine [tRNA(Phe)-imidazoG37] synthetase (radical SAM superfamily)
VLVTNSIGLDLPVVQQGLKHFTKLDEVWAKLDGGTQAYLNRVNKPDVPLEKILANILLTARQRPVVIQSLFPAINGEEPPLEEIDQYASRLLELKNAGAQISLVQIYSATRPTGAFRVRSSDAQKPFPHRANRAAGRRTEAEVF